MAREILDKETKYQAQAQFYASLTAEEKEILLNYFDKAENLSQKAQQISDLRTEVLLKEGYYYTYDKRQCEQYSEYKDAILTEAVESLTEEEAEILEKIIFAALVSVTNQIRSAEEQGKHDLGQSLGLPPGLMDQFPGF